MKWRKMMNAVMSGDEACKSKNPLTRSPVPAPLCGCLFEHCLLALRQHIVDSAECSDGIYKAPKEREERGRKTGKS